MAEVSDLKVACIVPTFNGKRDVVRLLNSLALQKASFDLLLVDSSSGDGTQEVVLGYPKSLVISSSTFNHGGTRQLMVEKYPDYDIYVFLTQDAYLEDEYAIGNLIAPFADPAVGAVCGRQLPHLDASPLAQHARLFNYPAVTQIKQLDDAPRLGIKTPFMSNSFSAYRRTALLAAGGFPSHVILSEDMYVGARMLKEGWSLVYCAEAECRHSHNYTLAEEFRRYFDQGVFHARESWIRESFGGAGGEGLRYVKSELRFLGVRRWYQWPSALLRNAVKLLAYKLGQKESSFKVSFKKRLSMHRRYWEGPFA